MPEDPTLRRLDALERRVAQLEERDAPESAPSADPPDSPASARPTGAAPTADAPLASAPSRPVADTASRPSPDDDPFWALTALKAQVPPPGAVVYAGSVEVGTGHVEYQWGRPTEHLLAADWAEHAETVAALGHPLRLAILRRLVDGEHTVAQLVDELELASTGVAYHHLSALQTGGWATSPRRGSWAIPPSRIVPLLAIVTALEKG